MSGRKWTPEEDAFLEKNWIRSTPEDLANHFRRTRAAVVARAYSLGLGQRYNGQGEYITVCRLCRAFGKAKGAPWAYKHLEANGMTIRRIKSEHKTFYMLRLAELWPWLQAHQTAWPAYRLEPFALGPEPAWVEEQRRIGRQHAARRHGALWTMEEEMLLRSLVRQKAPMEEICARLSRSEPAVAARASALCLDTSYMCIYRWHRWTPEEDAALRDMLLQGQALLTIKCKLGMTINAIRGRMKTIYGTGVIDKVRARILEEEVAQHGRPGRRKAGAEPGAGRGDREAEAG